MKYTTLNAQYTHDEVLRLHIVYTIYESGMVRSDIIKDNRTHYNQVMLSTLEAVRRDMTNPAFAAWCDAMQQYINVCKIFRKVHFAVHKQFQTPETNSKHICSKLYNYNSLFFNFTLITLGSLKC